MPAEYNDHDHDHPGSRYEHDHDDDHHPRRDSGMRVSGALHHDNRVPLFG